jgi:NAD(P)H-dependent FMN reductase
MPHLQIIVAATRQGRKGRAVGDWTEAQARAHGKFEVELIDLAVLNLPMLDEPEHPRLRKYHHDHTKAWTASVDRADAFVFVTPEYNYCPAPALVNALDYVLHEWAYKPAAFVSYGGVSGGLRAVQVTKMQMSALTLLPIVVLVTVAMYCGLHL